MNRIGVVVLLCLVTASSCSKKCQEISSKNQSITLPIREHAELVLASFSGEIEFTGAAPEGMVLTNNEGQLTLTGTPTRTGAFTYVITPKTLSCLEYEGGPSSVTEFDVYVAVQGVECANGELPSQTIDSCIGSQCEKTLEACNEAGHELSVDFPRRSIVSFLVKGDGRAHIKLRQYSAWFESASQGTLPPYTMLDVTPAAGESIRGWFFTHDFNGPVSASPNLLLSNTDAEHASNVTFTYSITSFDRSGPIGTGGTLNLPNSSTPSSPILMTDFQNTRNFQFSLAEPSIAWSLDVLGGCEHPNMTGTQSYSFLMPLEVGLWSATSSAVSLAANYRVAVRQTDGGVLSDGVLNPFTFSVHESQRVNIDVTPLDQNGSPIAFSNTCAFDGGFPPSVAWGGPQRLQLELLSPDAGP